MITRIKFAFFTSVLMFSNTCCFSDVTLTDSYSRDIVEQPGVRLIVLQTSIFSSSAGKDKNKAAQVELDWLHSQLESLSVNHQQAIILIQDDGVKNTNGSVTLSQHHWDEQIYSRFKAELTHYSGLIKSVITKHPDELKMGVRQYSPPFHIAGTLYKLSAMNTPIHTIQFMTYNIGSLPTIFGIQIANAEFLRPNEERVTEVAKVLNQWNQSGNKTSEGIVPTIVGFEEAFDPNVRSLLQKQLASFYPYNSGEYGQKILNAGSGLLLFSQYPILELSFHPYTNMMVGEEWLANKGFITAKLKVDDSYFVTVILTHLEAGGAIWRDQESKIATTSERRGVQMGEIYHEIETVADVPPAGYENLKYLKTFVMGDFNATLDSERQQKSISTGLSDNGFKEGQIKYPGQYQLFTILNNTVPSNFIEIRQLATQKGQRKTIDPMLLQKAIESNQFTGSTLPDDLLIKNKNEYTVLSRQNTEYKIIDGIFTSHDGFNGHFETFITSLNESSRYTFSMSDHLATLGRFSLDAG